MLWVFIVAGYTGFGFLDGEGAMRSPSRVEPLVTFVAMGIGTAGNVIAGLVVIARLKARRIGKVLAVATLLASGVASIMIPLLILRAVATAAPGDISGNRLDLFQGEHGMWVYAVAEYQFWAALATLLVFIIWIFPTAKSRTD